MAIRALLDNSPLMPGDCRWTISPMDILSEINLFPKVSNNSRWLKFKYCPFCGGGDHRDQYTFAMHGIEGNYLCSRSKCGERGTFWGFLLANNLVPKDFLTKEDN